MTTIARFSNIIVVLIVGANILVMTVNITLALSRAYNTNPSILVVTVHLIQTLEPHRIRATACTSSEGFHEVREEKEEVS